MQPAVDPLLLGDFDMQISALTLVAIQYHNARQL